MSDTKSKPQEFTEKQKKRMELMAADLPGLMEYAHSLGGFSVVPNDYGAIKTRGLTAMQEQAQMQIDQIAEQMKLLAKQAQAIKDKMLISQQIFQARYDFQPLVGKVYYLYSNQKGERRLSMIAPEEWNNSNSLTYIATVKLLADHTWSVVDGELSREF